MRTTRYPVLFLERFLGRIAESTEIISRLLGRNSGCVNVRVVVFVELD